MFFRYRRNAQLRWFDWGVRGVKRTPPVRLVASAPAQTVTQIHAPDLFMYLIAIKTFARFVPLRNIWVVGDRLEPEHKDLLQRHIDGVRIVDVKSIDTSGFPRGGTWERLLHIIDVSRDLYTIQLDADTITFAPPSEVLECARKNRCFSLGTSMGREAIRAHDLPAQLAHLAGTTHHVQVVAELAFGKLEPGARYIRGNSAFAGFAPQAVSRESLKRFSDAMSTALGASKWAEWGSEQVASNFSIANTSDPLVLPFARYRYFEPSADLSAATFLHFIGTHRFSAGVYRGRARTAIAELAHA